MALIFIFKDRIEEIQIKDYKLKLAQVDHSLKEMKSLAVTLIKFMALIKNTPPGFLTYENPDVGLDASHQIQNYFPEMEKVLRELDASPAEIKILKKDWDGGEVGLGK